ncbi:hypothetical protein DYBT9275_02806 [Dyadobacter sp. CECT 9275]|uniref:Uncharacterized protein n=1 Tax=Dyadobacter helix TaxID=2822344 RepID=A0A916JDB0_9BACT|nr:hypothetical protein [Dyadobacter sp. CECT 9275]CAG5002093.1 hypothetical protein DYBT9275_02806 [Dyadobacter sp. CECT 9275]
MKIVEEIVLYLERIGRLDSRDILFLRETSYLSYYFRTESEKDEYEYQWGLNFINSTKRLAK